MLRHFSGALPYANYRHSFPLMFIEAGNVSSEWHDIVTVMSTSREQLAIFCCSRGSEMKGHIQHVVSEQAHCDLAQQCGKETIRNQEPSLHKQVRSLISCSSKNSMRARMPSASRRKLWESVHMCPQCRLAIRLDSIDLKAVTTGIIVCPRCDWSGPIEIEIVRSDVLASQSLGRDSQKGRN